MYVIQTIAIIFIVHCDYKYQMIQILMGENISNLTILTKFYHPNFPPIAFCMSG